jgi:catechol 2,3-dioxygenase-like lactoylglutathione lyase family enzyme
MAVLTYPETTIIGTTDLPRMANFLAIFGAQPERIPDLSAEAASALYGIEETLPQLILHEPNGTERIRLVQTPHAAPAFEPLVAGPYGIDYYTRDLELSLDMLRAAGARNFSPLVGYAGEPTIHGPNTSGDLTHELLFQGPDDLSIFLTDIRITSDSWPTKLTVEPHRTHSEVLMLCWVVSDAQAERRFWTEEVGMEIVGDGHPENDEMQKLMFTPRNTPLHCLNITDAGHHHKMELMSYPQETLGVRPDWPLRGGFHGGGFYVEDLEAAIAALPSATFGAIVEADEGDGLRRAVSAKSPDAVRFEIWERSA